ncbi:MAG: biotin-dependent carboxyltransferase family protein [Chloroflexi bacterium]|nr:biotin-dependent carboxyltransferase family protein [Chloroflexota bacterium]
MDVLEVVEPGLLTTVQDLGRYGYQRYGVPVSGAMDPFALRAANLLVGNAEGEAGLEMTLVGPKLRFLADTVIAVAGGDLGPLLDGQPVPMWSAVQVHQGSLLSFAGVRDGMRAYVALAGGIDVPRVMGSRATYTRARIGGLEGRALKAGDRLGSLLNGPARFVPRQSPELASIKYTHQHILRVVLGPQDDAFTPEGIQTFLSSKYTVTPQSDRVGYRLQGPKVQHREKADIISDGVPFGAVQIVGDGMPIILLADRGTTGGYTKIATVISADLSQLAQAAPGDEMTFKSVTPEEGHEVLRQQEALLQRIRDQAAMGATRRFRVTVDGETYEVDAEIEGVPAGAALPPSAEAYQTTIKGKSRTYRVKVQALD